MSGEARILVVDDDQINLRLLEKILGAQYRVESTQDSYEAIRLIKTAPPDLILLDVMMPHLNGFEVCGIIREEERLRDIPILFLTGLNEAVTHVAGMNLGVVDYLLKPYKIENLLLRVRNYIQMKQRHDQVRAQHDLLMQQKALLENEIAERLALEARSQQMARLSALGQMASGVAHEINNPVAGIINCAELLEKRLPAGDVCLEVVERIHREGIRIARIVESLLSISHPGYRKRETVSIADCLDPVLTIVRDKLVNHGIRLETSIPENLPQLTVESQQIQQLLLNLLVNACHSLNDRFPGSDPGKQLRISAALLEEKGQQRLCLEVYDTGTGIPPEIIDKIFDPFFTTKPAGTGTGLGLTLCHEIVRQHDGDLRVESVPLSYTRFTVALPLHPD